MTDTQGRLLEMNRVLLRVDAALRANKKAAEFYGLAGTGGADDFRHDKSYYQGRVDALRDLRANIVDDRGEEA